MAIWGLYIKMFKMWEYIIAIITIGIAIAMIILFFLIKDRKNSGSQGPGGPTGPTGPTGATGPAGTSNVNLNVLPLTATLTFPLNGNYYVNTSGVTALVFMGSPADGEYFIIDNTGQGAITNSNNDGGVTHYTTTQNSDTGSITLPANAIIQSVYSSNDQFVTGFSGAA